MVDEIQEQPVFISVILCTYNRSEMLKGCLESLCRQTLDKKNYEVIVLNKNSNLYYEIP
jgi:glycosyltransferase involved in cell wall biosynthesis